MWRFKDLHCEVRTLSIVFQHINFNTLVKRILQFTISGLFGLGIGSRGTKGWDGDGDNIYGDGVGMGELGSVLQIKFHLNNSATYQFLLNVFTYV